jgi:ATP-dependent helicase/nuclease subunit B
VQARLWLGPAGSGKTFRCLEEIRQTLTSAAEGPPLLLIAPKQTTYQLERQLLAGAAVQGYTRLSILSFERLSDFVFAQLGGTPPRMLDEEGRLMVLRNLLARKRSELKLFRASARLAGFARQLSLTLSEFQRQQLTPEALEEMAGQAEEVEGLPHKLQDLAVLLREYLDWLRSHQLQDVDCLLDAASATLVDELHSSARAESRLELEAIWVDGFAELSPQEQGLLATLLPFCRRATITFCLDQESPGTLSWLSPWSLVHKSFEDFSGRLRSVPGAEVSVKYLNRAENQNRFQANPALRHLEAAWAEPRAFEAADQNSIRIAVCADPDAEATLAAREILRHVRAGGRYREISVLTRTLGGYHAALQRVLSRYEIPYFLDRRESVAHHPLAELVRSSLRTVARQWNSEDWFAALKTGLAPAEEKEIDELENEALARGWKGQSWHEPLRIIEPQKSDAALTRARELESRLERVRRAIMPPFERLALAISAAGNQPTGTELAAALRGFFAALKVEDSLRKWATDANEQTAQVPSGVHAAVWEQMSSWLENIELAFASERLALREWLPILEAGLSNLSVGVIPPALDQVLVGAIDRSRNPDIKLSVVLGLNEGVFPAPQTGGLLLTEADRVEMEKRGLRLGGTARQHLGREQYHAYIACTRARERLVLTRSLRNEDGANLNPSPILSHLRLLFPKLEPEVIPETADWREAEHANELVAPLLKMQSGIPVPAASEDVRAPAALLRLPALDSLMQELRHLQTPGLSEALSPELAMQVYGPVLRTSVSRLEQYGLCPFKFYVHSGLRAEERKQFELDSREQGSFQHDVLAFFHEELRREGKRWREITPVEARRRIRRIAEGMLASYREGLLQASEETRFTARMMIESLQDFVGILVGWMNGQYRFDPAQVELPFGEDGGFPAWEIDLGGKRRLALQGRIDRIDLAADATKESALCVVVDYKSSQKKLDPVLVAHGVQLQLLAYLNVAGQWPNAGKLFGADRLVPAGAFYVNLRGDYGSESNRRLALADPAGAHKLAYRHTGRFDASVLRKLDGREVAKGDQFNYKVNKDGQVAANSKEAMRPDEFTALLNTVPASLIRMGQEIFAGRADVSPVSKGTLVACEQCDYRAICRIDPWTHAYRILKSSSGKGDEAVI